MLFELVSLKNLLQESYKTEQVEHAISVLKTEIENIKLKIPTISADDVEFVQTMANFYEDILKNLRGQDQKFSDKINEINQRIAEIHKTYINDFFLEQRDLGYQETINNLKIDMYPDAEDIIIQRIRGYTDWRYPALEIGCTNGHWTKYLTAADPLYIMDRHQESLDTATGQFAAQYQSRLRRYKNNNYDFTALPQEQFGFIFSWNHFNYLNIATIARILQSGKKLLKPGGVMMFSFNDADTSHGANLVEQRTQSLVPKSNLITLCQNIGYEIIDTGYIAPNISWIEIRLPGSLTTVKAHQVLGKVSRRIH